MNITLDLPETLEIDLPRDAGTVTVDTRKALEASALYLVAYGLKQSIHDAASGAKATDTLSVADVTKALCEKRLAGIYAGMAPGERSGRDPLAVEIESVIRYAAKMQKIKLDKDALARLVAAALADPASEARKSAEENLRRAAKIKVTL